MARDLMERGFRPPPVARREVPHTEHPLRDRIRWQVRRYEQTFAVICVLVAIGSVIFGMIWFM